MIGIGFFSIPTVRPYPDIKRNKSTPTPAIIERGKRKSAFVTFIYAKCANTTVKIPKPFNSCVTDIGKTSVCCDFLNVKSITAKKAAITMRDDVATSSVSVIGERVFGIKPPCFFMFLQKYITIK